MEVLTFFVCPCVSENDQKKTAPISQPTPKKNHLADALLAGWTEIKVQLDFTCEVIQQHRHRSNRTLNEVSLRSLHSLKRTANLVLPLKMIGKMKIYKFRDFRETGLLKANTSPPKNGGFPLGISIPVREGNPLLWSHPPSSSTWAAALRAIHISWDRWSRSRRSANGALGRWSYG